jgi:hypothetical protein
MAMAMNQDIGSGIKLLGRQWHNLVEVIGKQFIPLLMPLFAWIGNVIRKFTQFAENHTYLTRVIVVGVGAIAVLAFTLGTLAATLGVVGLMVPNVIAGFAQVKAGAALMKTNILGAAAATKAWIVAQYKSLTACIANAGGIRAYAMTLGTSFLASMGAAITAVWSFTTALLANPVTWVVIGIAALGGALYFLYKKFETVRTVIDGFMYALGYMLGVCVRVGKGFLSALWSPIVSAQTLLSRAQKAITGLLSWIRGLFPEFLEAGRGLWGALVDGIKSVIMKPVEVVKKGLSFVRNLLPFSDAKEGPLSQLTLSGAQIMETLGAGVKASTPVLKNAVAGALAGVMIAAPAVAAPDILSEQAKPVRSAIAQNAAIEPPVIPVLNKEMSLKMKGGPEARESKQVASKKTVNNINIHNITLPNVSNAEDLLEQLKRLTESYDA